MSGATIRNVSVFHSPLTSERLIYKRIVIVNTTADSKAILLTFLWLLEYDRSGGESGRTLLRVYEYDNETQTKMSFSILASNPFPFQSGHMRTRSGFYVSFVDKKKSREKE